jgi:hypothetical protein
VTIGVIEIEDRLEDRGIQYTYVIQRGSAAGGIGASLAIDLAGARVKIDATDGGALEGALERLETILSGA